MWRSRWAAFGAAVAVTLGGGGIGLVSADIGSGERPVTVTIAPERILDTRVGLGGGIFTTDAPRDVQVTGDVAVASGGTKTVVPADAVAVLVNVTVVGPSSSGFLSLRVPGATGVPTTSTVNFKAGTIEPNAATADLGPGGSIQVYLKTDVPGGTANVLLDVVGYTVGHHHDDRYYTETEIDTKLAGLSPSEVSPWGQIPSGVTVRGNIHHDSTVWTDDFPDVPAGQKPDFAFDVALPALAPVALTNATVNFAPTVTGEGDANWIVDRDPACTGSVAVPTAPPGQVCIYVEDLRSVRNVEGVRSYAFDGFLATHGFTIRFDFDPATNIAAGSDFGINATWAYTAP